jgi:hypothetical protein
MLDEILRSLPPARYRVERIRETHRALLHEAEGLLHDVDCMSRGDRSSASAIRRRASALMDAVRADQAHQVDLIYEASEHDIWEYD